MPTRAHKRRLKRLYQLHARRSPEPGIHATINTNAAIRDALPLFERNGRVLVFEDWPDPYGSPPGWSVTRATVTHIRHAIARAEASAEGPLAWWLASPVTADHAA